MSTRLVYNFRYDAAMGYVADSVDTKLCYEKLYLDYRPACYVLVEACGTQRSNFLTPHVLKFVSLIQDVLLLRQTQNQNQQAEDVASYTCYVTDIVLRGERANFIQCIVNDLGLDITPDFMGQLVIVEFTSHAAYKLCYQTLKNNSAAPWYRSLPDICEIGVALQLYKCAFGTPMASKGTPPHVECLGFKVTDRIDLLDRFLPLGFYHTFNGTGVYTKLNLLTHKPPSLERILPMVSIDIETVARSPHVVPMGTTHDEKISSLSMYLLYGQIHVHVCLYLNPTPARMIATASDKAAVTTAAAQFEKKMNCKYNNQPEGEGDRPRRRLFTLFKGYDSEKAMLEVFYEYYSQGGIFLLVDLPRRYPHILTGHNLIAYDLRVIWRRMIFLKIEQLLHSVHRIKHEHDELHHPEFNDLAIVLDLMVLAKKNMLSDKLSLAAIAANRLRSEHVTKMDLDSSIIRRVYAYAVAATHSSEASADFNKVYRVSSAPPTYSSHDDNFDFTDTRVELVRLKRALYKDTRLSDVPELMPRLEQVLIYNIQDTITVTRVLLDSNILALVTELTSLFCLNAEESGMCGNSRRLAACLVHNGLKHGTFIANRCDRTGIGPLDTYHSFSGGGGGGDDNDFEDVDNDHRESGADAATAAAASRRVVVSRRRTARIGGLATDRTNKAYQGALNYARDQEFFNAVESFDFKSYYPNLSCYLNADSTNCSVITVEFIQSLSPAIVAILERCVRADLVRLFAMQDPCVPTEELLTPGYRGREIGHCLCWEDVCALDSREPVLAMFEMDTRERFIGRVLDGLLKQRRQLQEALRAATSLTERRILDSQQLGTKIILNSVYGVTGCSSFLYSHIPASAAVTLFGRKFLTICARLICTFYALASTEGGSSSSSSDGGDVRAWYEAELQYLTTWAVNRSSQKAGERAVIAAGRGCSGGDGYGDRERMSAAERKQRIPFADLVCYVDTDGLKFYNPNNVDAAAILKRVNEAMSFTKYLTLAIEKRHDHVMILTKKKYAYCDVENGMNVGHVGYERHANSIVKKILTGVVRVCCERAATNPLYVLFDILGCLHATNPCLLFERIKLNHHENESSLQRYIDSVSKDYKGDIKTVLLLDDGGDVTRDLYEPQVVWSAHQRPLNLAKFIRKFHKIIKRLLMSAQSRHEIWSKTQMESPLLIYAAYHAWLDKKPNRLNEDKVLGKIVPLVEFIRPHLHNYQMIAKQTLPLEDAIDSHNVRLKKRSSGHVRVIRKLI